MIVTAAQIKQISMNTGRPDICQSVADFITNHGADYQLDTALRVKHFLGQMAIESTFFSKMEESLNYTTEQRLMTVWPSRFPTVAAARPFVENPKGLADYVYSNRDDLGNTGGDDGWNYRGSGLPSLTGKANFKAFTAWMQKLNPTAPDFVQYPDLLRTVTWGVYPAAWFWVAKGCAPFADKDDVNGLTRRINGGLTGLKDRTQATSVAGKILNLQTNPVVVSTPPKQSDPLLQEYQQKLITLSKKLNMPAINPGDADGWNGPATEKAVNAFQAYVKLEVDGKCGPNTRNAIDRLLA